MKRRLFVSIMVLCCFVNLVSLNAKAATYLVWPVPGHTALSQGFHNGSAIDISDGNIAGATVVAAMGGVVTYKYTCSQQHYKSDGDCHGFGTGIVINGDDGRIYQYAHMQGGSIPSDVYVGGRVSAGQKIGQVGTTGNSSGNHLHFGISTGEYWYESGIDPSKENYDDPVKHTPVGYVDAITNPSVGKVRVSGWTYDPDALSQPISVHVYIGGTFAKAITANLSRKDVDNVYHVGEFHGFDAVIDTSKTGNQNVTVYAINVGEGQGSNPSLDGSKTINIQGDTEKPVITDAKVIDLDSSGYTVQCKVTDNVAVDRVQCPTWTKEGDQDDIAKDWGTNSSVRATNKGNGIYEFRVKISDHNNEYGIYHTHIYAYDTCGNCSSVTLNYNNVLMGSIFDIGNDTYKWIKPYNGGYCRYIYSSNSQSDSVEDKYMDVFSKLADTCQYSDYVYHFVKNDDVYNMYFGTASLGKCLIIDDGTKNGYLISQYGTNNVWTYDEDNKQVKLKKFSKGNTNQYFKFEDIIKKDRYYSETDSYVEYDGKEHFIDFYSETYDTIYYRTSEQSEWSTENPKRIEVGTTKVYYKKVSPCYNDTYGMANITIKNKDNCSINIRDIGLSSMFRCQHARGMVIAPEVSDTTTFSSYKIVTSVIKNGKLITDEHEYGPITIESGSSNALKAVLVAPINFENADGEYTTTIALTSVTGEKYQRTIQYNFKYYDPDIVKTIRIGDKFSISSDVTNNENAFGRVLVCPDEYNSGDIDLQKDEDVQEYKITGTKVGRVYLYCKRSLATGREVMMIIDIVDNNSSDIHAHDYSEIVTKQPTCIEKGLKEFTCSCGDSYTEDIPATGHNMEETVIAPTATEDGYTLHKCTNTGCDYEYKDNIILHETTDVTHQHNYIETITKAPTCLEAGLKTYACECGATYTEDISATGHNYVCEVVAPTSESMGYTLHTCSVCGDSYKDNYTKYNGNGDSDEKPNNNTTDNPISSSDRNTNDNSNEKVNDASNNNVSQSQTENSSNAQTNNNSNNGEATKNENITLSAMTVTKATPSTDRVRFSWDTDSNATGFIIEYSTKADLSDRKSGTWDKNYFGSYVLGDLAENTTYYYRLRSFKGDGDTREYSEWTTIESFTTKAKTVTTESNSNTTSITVKAPKIKIKSFKNNKKGKAVVKWKINFDVDGYQVSVSKKKSFSGAKKKNVNAYIDSITVSGLKKGKTYYAKVRSYVKNDNGKKVYGKWSSIKKVKIKK